jgi:hypothetical protein
LVYWFSPISQSASQPINLLLHRRAQAAVAGGAAEEAHQASFVPCQPALDAFAIHGVNLDEELVCPIPDSRITVQPVNRARGG